LTSSTCEMRGISFAPGCAPGPLKEARRSGDGEPANRPHPAAKQAIAARFAITLEPDGCLGVVYNDAFDDRAALSKAPVAFENRRLERSTALEAPYPAHAGRSCLSYPERPTQSPSDLAPAPGSCAGSYPRLLSCLRAVEEPGKARGADKLLCASVTLATPLGLPLKPSAELAAEPSSCGGRFLDRVVNRLVRVKARTGRRSLDDGKADAARWDAAATGSCCKGP
jgi:hypothetical protein